GGQAVYGAHEGDEGRRRRCLLRNSVPAQLTAKTAVALARSLSRYCSVFDHRLPLEDGVAGRHLQFRGGDGVNTTPARCARKPRAETVSASVRSIAASLNRTPRYSYRPAG